MLSLATRFLVFCLLCSSTVIVQAQGALGNNASKAGASQVEPAFIQSKGMTFIVPRSRNKLLAFSTITSNWSHTDIAIDPGSIKDLKIYPTVGNTLAACKLGSELHAYSAKNDRWAKLKLPQDRRVNFSIGDNIITAYIQTDRITQIYVFGEDSQDWSGVDLATGEMLNNVESQQ